MSLYTKNSSGGVWFDNTRIPLKASDKLQEGVQGRGGNLDRNKDWGFKSVDREAGLGRFPANLLCGFPISKEELRSEYPEATEEELDKMVSMIENPIDVDCEKESDLSRYFSLTAWAKKHFPNLHNISEKTLQLQEDIKKTGDLLFVAKPSQSEKNSGLDGFECGEPPASARSKPAEGRENALGKLRQNTHPTTKPIALYNYLITLFSKEGDIILDPFCGSGVTPIACVLTNRKYIGIDISEEYCAIANARVEYWKQQKNGASASISNVSASKKEEQETLF